MPSPLYTCNNAKKDIDFFFEGTVLTPEKDEALNRALYGHMTCGSVVGNHNIACKPCWDYYMEQKRMFCGG